MGVVEADVDRARGTAAGITLVAGLPVSIVVIGQRRGVEMVGPLVQLVAGQPVHQPHHRAAAGSSRGADRRNGPARPSRVKCAVIEPRRPIFIISPIVVGAGRLAHQADRHRARPAAAIQSSSATVPSWPAPSSSPVMARITAPSGGVSVHEIHGRGGEGGDAGFHVGRRRGPRGCRPRSRAPKGSCGPGRADRRPAPRRYGR